MATIFQQLGGLVYTYANLGNLDKFYNAGGRWIAPVVYGDDVAGPYNLSKLGELQALCKNRITVGGWFNGFGHDPISDASAISSIATKNNLTLILLDLEAAYQYPQGNADLMPLLVREVRKKLPTANIIVSTNGLNSASIWNGRTLSPQQSFFDLGIRVAPQWYSAYYLKDNHTEPVTNMSWLKAHASSDGNFADKTAPNGRGVPLSYIHPTLEVTGLEGSSLSDEIARTKQSKKYGFTTGISIYTLENAPDSDFALLQAEKGNLFLV